MREELGRMALTVGSGVLTALGGLVFLERILGITKPTNAHYMAVLIASLAIVLLVGLAIRGG